MLEAEDVPLILSLFYVYSFFTKKIKSYKKTEIKCIEKIAEEAFGSNEKENTPTGRMTKKKKKIASQVMWKAVEKHNFDDPPPPLLTTLPALMVRCPQKNIL